MRINSMQNNNQSFGMSFKVKENGAKKLAEIFVDSPKTEKYVMNNIIKPIQSSKSEVIFDGENAIVKSPDGSKVFGIYPKDAIPMPNNRRDIQYITDRGIYHINYNRQKDLDKIKNQNPTIKMLFNAKEIAKDLEEKMFGKTTTKAKKLSQEEKTAQKTKHLQDLFG